MGIKTAPGINVRVPGRTHTRALAHAHGRSDDILQVGWEKATLIKHTGGVCKHACISLLEELYSTVFCLNLNHRLKLRHGTRGQVRTASYLSAVSFGIFVDLGQGQVGVELVPVFLLITKRKLIRFIHKRMHHIDNLLSFGDLMHLANTWIDDITE